MATVADKHVSLYQVLVDGAELDPEVASVIREVRVVDYLALPDLCTFTVGYPRAEEGQPAPIDDHPFDIGKSVEIKLGAREELQTKSVFKGEIVTLEPNFGSGGVEMIVRAFDRSHHFHRSRKVRTWQNQTASDIVEKIVQENGLVARCDPSGVPFEFMQQDNETDLDFIWKLAHRIGFEFVVDDTQAYFRKAASTEPLPLYWPDEVTAFRPRVTAVQQVEEVTVRAFDPKTKQVISSTKSEPEQFAEAGIERKVVRDAFPGAAVHVATEPVATQAQADALGQALLDRFANAYVAAEGSCDGNPVIKAGTMVHISGVGEQFSGTYRVLSSTHVLRGGSTYQTEFTSSSIQTLAGAVAASRPQDFGDQLVLGVVTNNQDPDGMGRVRVRYPALGDDHEGWWARVAVPSAGKERGLMMLPVPDEEVLVGFEHGDTTRPYVIGSLFNGIDSPGEELAAVDGSYGMRSDKKMIMRSKEDMTITSDKTFTMEIQGDATYKYSSSLKEEIQGEWSAKGSTSITIEAGSQLTIKGAMINIESNGPLSIKGNPVDIDGGAMVNVKGGMINLG